MAGMIPDEKINQIRQANDIVDVIGDYIHLKKQGRNYFGLCPFHGENTPSFSVSADKQIYHCFGCGMGGNVFSFIMDIDGASFQEAVVKLAERADIDIGVTLGDQDAGSARVSSEARQMIEAHELLRKFYHHLLINTKEGQHALEYLLERGFTKESIDKFQIGYALPTWDFTVKLLQKRGYSLSVLEKAGLIIKREEENSFFDRFRNRIMFPILDPKGVPVAFAGRAIEKNDQPKYLNSPETDIFNKSSILYNWNHARSSIKKQQQIILFEGFADVISADRAGIHNGVATMGTSLTDQHVQLIRRTTDSVVISYDSDKAGTDAAYRAAEMLIKNGCQVKIARMRDGLDPDEYIKKFGPEKFQHDVIGGSLTFMAFKMQYFRMGKNLQNEGEKLQYIEEIIKEIAKLEKAIEREHYMKQLADEFDISLEALSAQQQQVYFKEKKKNPNGYQEIKPNRIYIQNESKLFPAHHNAERCLLAHMLRDDQLAFKINDMLQGSTFHYDEHQAVFTYLLGYYEDGNEPSASSFLNYLPDEKLRRVVTNIEMMSLNLEISEGELEDYVKQVLKQHKMLKIKEKENDQKAAERENDLARALHLANEIIQLRKTL
ncbi:DNA primase [Heyndrickxia acidicola]|uniref:DNA primase n=1 Tax=Heyndrickxia acidicola TaxID=209389 RepID=A0ABU6MK90_9BACI|nr:DNA primase [Heyndrickxia acidicola]MED1205106.1 DNA primase [Heyndrickxia acidicola]